MSQYYPRDAMFDGPPTPEPIAGTPYLSNHPRQTLRITNVTTRAHPDYLKWYLLSLFSLYGRVLQVSHGVGKARGKAFIVYRNIMMAINGKTMLNGYAIIGDRMIVEYASKDSDIVQAVRVFDVSVSPSYCPSITGEQVIQNLILRMMLPFPSGPEAIYFHPTNESLPNDEPYDLRVDAVIHRYE